MSIVGKIIGGGTGFVIGGPIGAIVGDTVDSILRERSRIAFFTATFWVMGHISKADGQVSSEEIDLATGVMEKLGLDAEECDDARRLFSQGRDSKVDLAEIIEPLREDTDDPRLIDKFIRIQIDTAYADGHLDPHERKILEHIQHLLDLPPDTVDSILRERSHIAFFTATFWVMGHISKADGQVSKEEIDFATGIMEKLGLDAEGCDDARRLFSQGRDSKVDLAEIIEPLREDTDDPRLIDKFIRIQIDIAYADGHLDPRERKILERIQHLLDLHPDTVDSILREKSRIAFFTATFWVMGHISKADGQVSKEEIDLAMGVMEWMDIDADECEFARKMFIDGRDSSLSIDDVLGQLRRECNDSELIELFLQIQIDAAMADGEMHPRERYFLEHVQHRLGLPAGTVDSILNAKFHERSTHDRSSDDWAYETLELNEGRSKEDIERAYRRMMNRYHPDKLASKGLPEEMMRIANEKTRKIRAAYEHLRQVHSTM